MRSNLFKFCFEKKIYIYYLTGYPVTGKIIGRISGQISIRYNPRWKKYSVLPAAVENLKIVTSILALNGPRWDWSKLSKFDKIIEIGQNYQNCQNL